MFDAVVNLFKSKRKVVVIQPRDDRTIDIFTLPVEDRSVVDEKNSQAWGLRSDMLMPYKGKPALMVIEHDCSPISLNGEQFAPEIKAIAAESYDKEKAHVEKEGIKAKAQNFILLIMLIPATSFIIVLLTRLLENGTLRLPFSG